MVTNMYEQFFEEDPHATRGLELRELKALVRQGEGQQLEFKQKAAHPEKICRGVVAFANTQGGTLLIGIADNKELVGLKFADDDEFVLVRAIEKYITPPVAYQVQRLTLDNGREILIFTIEESTQKPHYLDLKLATEEPKAYVRVADKSIQANKEMREVLKGQRKGRSVKFTYGDKERLLLAELEKQGTISVEEFAVLAGVSMRVASRTLVLLTLANVLEILPMEEADRFAMKPVDVPENS